MKRARRAFNGGQSVPTAARMAKFVSSQELRKIKAFSFSCQII
jgi:hypothetical protein